MIFFHFAYNAATIFRKAETKSKIIERMYEKDNNYYGLVCDSYWKPWRKSNKDEYNGIVIERELTQMKT